MLAWNVSRETVRSRYTARVAPRRRYRCEECDAPFTSGYYRKPGYRTCVDCSRRRMEANNDLQRSPVYRQLLLKMASSQKQEVTAWQ